MTVTSSNNLTVFTGNGVTTEFDCAFRADSSDHVTVFLIEIATNTNTTLVLDTDYSLANIGEEAGFTVTYPVSGSPLPSTHKIAVRRVVPYTQETAITPEDGWNPEVIENQLDLMVMQTQQIAEEVGRAWKSNYGETGKTIATVDEGHYLVADADGNLIDGGTAPNVFTFLSSWCGVATANPTVNLNGDALTGGELYYNTAAPALRVYTGSAWVDVGPITSNASSISSGTLAEARLPAPLNALSADAKALLDDASFAAMRATMGVAAASHTHATSEVTGLDAALTAKAALASPNFSGTPQIGGSNIIKASDAAVTAQSQATWTAGVGTTESIISPAKLMTVISSMANTTPVAGDVWSARAPFTVVPSNATTTYSTAFDFRITATGQVRVRATQFTGHASLAAYLRVMKNGVQQVEWTTTSLTGVERTTDISVTAGDTVTLEIKSSGGTAYAKYAGISTSAGVFCAVGG